MKMRMLLFCFMVFSLLSIEAIAQDVHAVSGGTRQRPARLAEKLTQIRLALGLSQNEMISRLGLGDELIREAVSAFELGTREPPLPILLRYARVACVSTDVLIDDELDLPESLPASRKDIMGVRVSPVSHSSKR